MLFLKLFSVCTLIPLVTLQEAAETGFVLETDNLGIKWYQPVWATGPGQDGKHFLKIIWLNLNKITRVWVGFFLYWADT